MNSYWIHTRFDLVFRIFSIRLYSLLPLLKLLFIQRRRVIVIPIYQYMAIVYKLELIRDNQKFPGINTII